MALTSVYLAEEALSLPAEEREALARLLMASVVASHQKSDEEVQAELRFRLARLKSGEDQGLSFDAVFGERA